MPNHYNNVLVLFPDYDSYDGRDEWTARIVASEWGKDPVSASVPMPADVKAAPNEGLNPPWYVWAKANWGTQWSAYNVRPPTALPGDGIALLWMWATAWRPPHAECRAAIAAKGREVGVRRIVWLGVDPYDDSVNIVDGVLGPEETP